MKFSVEINVMPHKALLDPQGKAVNATLKNIGFKAIEDVRIGKHMTFEIEAKDEMEAKTITDDVCKKVLSNPIVENFDFSLKVI